MALAGDRRPPRNLVVVVLVGLLTVIGLTLLWMATRSPGPPSFPFDDDGLVAEWNEAALAAGRADLGITALQRTTDDTVGFAWSPTLTLVARVETGPERRVVELAALGVPDRDEPEDVVAVFDILLRVADGGLDADQRVAVLESLALADAKPPASLRTAVRSDRFEFSARSADGQVGLGVIPLLPG